MRLKHYLYAARAYCLVALVPALVIAALVYGYEARKPKTYTSSATLFVQSPTNSQSGNNAIITNALIPSYSQMITEPVITQAVDKKMSNKGYPNYSIATHGLTTQQNPGTTTSLVVLSVTDTRPARAATAANIVAWTFIGQLTNLEDSAFNKDLKSLRGQITTLNGDIQSTIGKIANHQASLQPQLTAQTAQLQSLLASQAQTRIARDSVANTVELYSPATAPSAPVGPHPLQAALLAFAVVLLLGIGGVRLYYYLDDSLHKPEEIEEIAGAPILGSVLRFPVAKSNGAKGQPLISAVQPRSPAAESYRLIRTNLLYADIDNPPRTLVITSAKPGEGKSTTAGNLARVFAEGGHATAVIDADLRRPTLHRIFGVSGRRGLTTMLVSDPPNGRDAQTTDLPNLQIIASGPLPPNPADLLGSQRMSTLLGKLGEGSDSYVLLDSPPILSVADAAALSTMADGVVLVVDLKQTKGRDLRRAREAIETVGGRLLGVVVNRLSEHGTSYYYYHSYGYQTTYEASPEPLPAPESVSDNGREAAIHAGEQAGVS